ncbi:uncharacterized protein BDZ99DRAFT_572621 [Mytilinidion resinicola]|uniref:Uncharacterized protein n=1 Tax=Mytilinidion resinicola TaxID=574789 RepID=A0A6A6YFZ2_9PEZI|nr:uncharacterized protein BDZ99DRAFT_572621 [Mytilinidion resinicola]KAF2807721.1 hypothetical protein BDZ99DRAFT_572621 [Mytilinidion resinicola]
MAASQIFTTLLGSAFADVRFARDDTTQQQRDDGATFPSGVYFRTSISAPARRDGLQIALGRPLRAICEASSPASPHTAHSAPRPLSTARTQSKTDQPATRDPAMAPTATAAASSPDAADWCNGRPRPQNARQAASVAVASRASRHAVMALPTPTPASSLSTIRLAVG